MTPNHNITIAHLAHPVELENMYGEHHTLPAGLPVDVEGRGTLGVTARIPGTQCRLLLKWEELAD